MFKHSFSFEGRIGRTEYAISLLVFIVSYSFFALIGAEISNAFANLLILIGLVGSLWFLLAQGAKRSHDIGNSGWWQIVPFYTLWLLFQKGIQITIEQDKYSKLSKESINENGQKKHFGAISEIEQIQNSTDSNAKRLNQFDLSLREIEKKQSLLFKSEANGLLTQEELIEKNKALNVEKSEILKNKTSYELRRKAEINSANKIKELTLLKENGLINSDEYNLKIEDLIMKEIEVIKRSSE